MQPHCQPFVFIESFHHAQRAYLTQRVSNKAQPYLTNPARIYLVILSPPTLRATPLRRNKYHKRQARSKILPQA